VFAFLRGRGVTKQRLANTVHIYPKDLDALTFGLAIHCLDAAPDAEPSIERLRPRLALVGSQQ